MQNPKRDLDYLPVGIRECFVARPGTLFADNDFSGLELCTVAQVCIEVVGESALADAINAGKDPHLMTAATLMGVSYEEVVHRKHDPIVKQYRQRSKVLNFGLPGGLGPEGLIAFARGYGLRLTLDEAKALKAQWLDALPEFKKYFTWVREQLNLSDQKDLQEALAGLSDIDEEQIEKYSLTIPTGSFAQLYVGRFRGRCRFTNGANTMFQGLGADGAKNAAWKVARRCYDKSLNSVLYGVRPVAFVHDEILAEVDEDHAHEQAFEMARVMVDACNVYLPDVPVKCAPALGKYWSKGLEGVFDTNGRLQPYDLAKAGKWKVFYADGQPVNWKV
jgi:DNA polymerase I-like protein with 3'-5' exonuclease and polymerase domains